MLASDSYLFMDYDEEYGIFRNDGELIGFREDAPEEVKRSWEKYLEDCKKNIEIGIK